MLLYDADWAPNPRRVRVFLAEKGIEVPRVAVDLRAGEHRQDAYREINPRATVPALRLDDGEVIGDSVAICRYLEALHSDPPLFGATPVEVARVEVWTRRIEQDGYLALVQAFRESHPGFESRPMPGDWPPLPQIPALGERARTVWGAFLDGFDAHLADREWVAGDRFSFADITGLVAVDFARAARVDGPETRPNVHRWREAVGARPSAMA